MMRTFLPLLVVSLCIFPHGHGFVSRSFSSKRLPLLAASTAQQDDVIPAPRRPVAVVTGVSRSIGIGKAVAQQLTDDGFQVVATGWKKYDERMPWGSDNDVAAKVNNQAFDYYYELDLEDAVATENFVPQVVHDVGTPVSVLVLCHCESVDSDIYTTTVESFDKHMAVNVRATWQLIQGLAKQYKDEHTHVNQEEEEGSPQLRIVSITSDHTAGNLPYGASKGAMDRIVLAAAEELKDLGITSNVINPGATDTGWMSPEITDMILDRNLQDRVGQPSDVANLVTFLCSEKGQWINGQLLYSDGGLRFQ